MVVDEYSTECDICGCYNVKIICPNCLRKYGLEVIEDLKQYKTNDTYQRGYEDGIMNLITLLEEKVEG